MDLLDRFLLRAEQHANWLDTYLIPKFKDEIDRKTKEMLEIKEAVRRVREDGDEEAIIDLTRLAFRLKGEKNV